MESDRFDRLVRALNHATTRRRGFRAVVTGIALVIGGRTSSVAAPHIEACIPVGRRCGHTSRKLPCRHCCSRYATSFKGHRRCTCRPDGRFCSNSSQCCNGRCVDGKCADTCIPLTAACDPATAVCCTFGAVCQTTPEAPAPICCRPFGFPCDSSLDCCEAFCDPDLRRCASPPPAG